MSSAEPPQNAATGWRARWHKWRQTRWFRWGSDAAFVVVLFVAVSMVQNRGLLPAGEHAPKLELTSLDGTAQTLGGPTPGQRTLLVFWAPWCGVCGAESDNVDRVRRWLGDRVRVVSVALGYAGLDSVRDFVAEQSVAYPVLLGRDRVQKAYQVSAFPTLYVLDERGRIAHRATGYTTTLGMLWRLLV